MRKCIVVVFLHRCLDSLDTLKHSGDLLGFANERFTMGRELLQRVYSGGDLVLEHVNDIILLHQRAFVAQCCRLFLTSIYSSRDKREAHAAGGIRRFSESFCVARASILVSHKPRPRVDFAIALITPYHVFRCRAAGDTSTVPPTLHWTRQIPQQLSSQSSIELLSFTSAGQIE